MYSIKKEMYIKDNFFNEMENGILNGIYTKLMHDEYSP